jgi:hypothetical protein
MINDMNDSIERQLVYLLGTIRENIEMFLNNALLSINKFITAAMNEDRKLRVDIFKTLVQRVNEVKTAIQRMKQNDENM